MQIGFNSRGIGRSAGALSWRAVFGGEVERQQILDVGIGRALGQLGQRMG